MTDPANWLLDWFRQKGPVPGGTVEEQLRVNYFEAKLIDSLTVINLILEIEKRFGIQFSPEDFQDRRFATIGGLSELITELSLISKSGSSPKSVIHDKED
ncbi:MAG: phosphopantetheine-binding protein [Nitrospira sp.]|nr:phosphopantetheine-binding protein [Nitrospira sp.]